MPEQNLSNTNPANLAGRLLRFLLGALLLASVLPVYARVSLGFTSMTALVVLGLVAVFTLLHMGVSRYGAALNRWVGAVLAVALLVAVYILGSPDGILFGRGEGQLAALTFLSMSLLLAAIRADSGCEVMSIPGALLGQRSHLVCLVFSPIDWLERTLRANRTR